MCTSQASCSSNPQQEEKDDKRDAKIAVHVEPVLKSRRIRKNDNGKTRHGCSSSKVNQFRLFLQSL